MGKTLVLYYKKIGGTLKYNACKNASNVILNYGLMK
jgi:hypothetical protein